MANNLNISVFDNAQFQAFTRFAPRRVLKGVRFMGYRCKQ